ncbi:hypothetical protein [Flavihumibacter sp.]|uniref:hypothetical protein n=1 Tax=Flavihumibacter sp. TaxID=1913981 RepID=UPI002FCB1314
MEFEKLTKINIPKDVVVTKQEYLDMNQDFAKKFEIKLNRTSLADLKLSILNSTYYNSAVFIDNGIIDSKLFQKAHEKGLWYRDNNGYSFYGFINNGREVVIAKVDTLAMTAKFEYGSD